MENSIQNKRKKKKFEFINLIFDYSYENEGKSFIRGIKTRNIIKNRKKLFRLKTRNLNIQIKFTILLLFCFVIISILFYYLLFFSLKALNIIPNEIILKNATIITKNVTSQNIENITTKNIENITTNNIENIINVNTEDLNKTKINMNNGKLLWNNEVPNIAKIREEMKSYENLDINITIKNKEELYKREKPKISIIITVYNQAKFLNRVYSSILKQDFKDIEIIFIDDASTDNSSNIIKEYMKEDKRIVYLKNDINRRTFYSRSKGIYNSTGEYIIIIDPDDYIFNNILLKLYNISKLYNLDILQFYMFIGDRLFKEVKYKDGIMYQPHIKNIFYYGYGRNIVDKLVKRDIFIKAIEFMDEKYRNERFQLHDDDVCFFGLINVANSYGFLEDIGYKYSIGNPNSTMGSRFNPENMDNIFHSLFCIMKYFYEKTGNDIFEKKMVGYNFFLKKVLIYQKYIKYLHKDFEFYNEVLDLYLNSTFFNIFEKKKLKSFKDDINNFIKYRNKTSDVVNLN